MRRRPAATVTRGLAAAVVGFAVAACTAGSDRPEAAEVSDSPVTSAVATTPSPTPAPEPVALPDSCSGLLPVPDLEAALGTGLPGSVSYVRGQPIPDIGRTDRITCGYGVVIGEDATAQPPLLEISVASYTDAAAAADRIDVTTTDRQNAGDRIDSTEVQGRPGVLLTSVSGTTLIFADGAWTYSLTLLAAVLPPERTPAGLTGVATAVLERANAPAD